VNNKLLVAAVCVSSLVYADAYDTLLRRYERQIQQQEKQLGTLRSRLLEKEREANRWQHKAEEARDQWTQAGSAVEKTRSFVHGVRDQLKQTRVLAEAAEWAATEQTLLARVTDEQVAALAREVYARQRLEATVPSVSLKERLPVLVLKRLAGYSSSVHDEAKKAQAEEAVLRTKQLQIQQQEQKQMAELEKLHQKQRSQWLRWQEANQRKAALEEEKNQMEQSAQALKVMVQELRDHRDHALASRQGRTSSPQALSAMRGSLPWPAAGKVTQSFGRQYSQELKQLLVSNGIKIETGPNRNVRAIQAGKVLFASPFRQYGQLIIVQHKSGIASVYGSLGETRVKEGDALQALDIIGTTGDTGSFYFEIRHEEQPVNPLVYLSPNTQRADISSRRSFK
jgi:septal ring factor EnvC (AmiA/AmiB activator)